MNGDSDKVGADQVPSSKEGETNANDSKSPVVYVSYP